jgi:DMSO/TMAO reductase YedYZ molybdopterin-dependent catalytic subunit
MQRRDLLRSGGLAGIAMLSGRAFAQSGAAGDKTMPWSDQPPPVPPPLKNVAKGLTRWEDLGSWITPNDKFFSIAHYNRPQVDAKAWRLDVSGQVGQPTTLSLDQLKALPRQQVTFTIECSGNNGLPFLTSAIGNARWGGTPLAEVLRNADIKSSALEVVFFGADSGEETVRKDTPLEFNS